ncbi:MAG: zinc-ribbon domain-containing protein [bacterium]
MYCPKCGTQNDANNVKCTNCGQILNPESRVAAQSDDTLSSIIPYKNVSALIAYYLGVFSLIPCLGIFLGIGAVILGLIGLKYAKKHPEAKGKVHAWVGIIAGSIFAILYIILLIMLFSGK